jgi:hypothetical protein
MDIRSLLSVISPREEEVLLLRLEALKYREIVFPYSGMCEIFTIRSHCNFFEPKIWWSSSWVSLHRE